MALSVVIGCKHVHDLWDGSNADSAMGHRLFFNDVRDVGHYDDWDAAAFHHTHGIDLYSSFQKISLSQDIPVAPTGAFVLGYVAMWLIFSLLANIAQWGLDQAALLSPMMVSNSVGLGAALLIAAGIYASG